MSRKLINLIIFMIMMFSLTAMPINLSALQFDVSWKKYHQIEQDKVEAKVQETLAETAEKKVYHLSSNEPEVLVNPTTLTLTLTGDEQLNQLNDDIINNIEVSLKVDGTEFATYSGKQLGTLTIEEQAQMTKIILDLNVLNLPEGEYEASIRSKSELTASNPPIQIKMSYFKNENYAAALPAERGSQYVTLFYPNAKGTYLIPFTQKLSASKQLRKIVTTLTSDAPADLGVQSGPIIPRINNIQLKSGLLSLYVTESEAKAFAALHPSGKIFVEALARTFYSIDYIKTIDLYVNKQKTGIAFNDVTLEQMPVKEGVSKVYLSAETTTKKLVLVPVDFPAGTGDVAGIFAKLKSGGTTLSADVLQAVIPGNVNLNAFTPVGKVLQLDLKVEGDVYGGSVPLTQRMLDALTWSYLSSGVYESLQITINGQSVETLNTLAIKEPLKKPLRINPID